VASFDVKVKLGGQLDKLRRAASNPATIQKMFLQWSRIYGAFIRRRFNTYSRGGGDWPALALSTVLRRRKGKRVDKKRSSLARDTSKAGKGRLVQAGGTVTILRDTGLLFAQLDPQLLNPGPVQSSGRHVFKATVEFGGTAKYPDGKATVTDILSFHQRGGGRLPRRKILVDPDEKTLKQLATSGKRILLNG
jgi:hypothetical protein